MTDREAACRALAVAMGWKYERWPGWRQYNESVFRIGEPNHYGESRDDLDIPAPDAPLHEKLGFVGRLAEAVGAESFYLRSSAAGCVVQWIEPRNIEAGGAAPDLVLAAIQAATQAKRSSS